jgi:hypothetical protein
MKRIMMAVAVAAVAVVSAPKAAHAQTGCAWWDLTCNGLANTVSDYGWHAAGRDANGNPIYVRRLVDSNENVVFEQAHRNAVGRYLVGNTHTLRKGTVYGSDGTLCKYSSNDKGYKEDCKYARRTVVSGVRPTNTRTYSSTGDCKYKSNPKGYSEQCKYAKPQKEAKPIKYDKHSYGVKGAKIKEGKIKGPKH